MRSPQQTHREDPPSAAPPPTESDDDPINDPTLEWVSTRETFSLTQGDKLLVISRPQRAGDPWRWQMLGTEDEAEGECADRAEAMRDGVEAMSTNLPSVRLLARFGFRNVSPSRAAVAAKFAALGFDVDIASLAQAREGEVTGTARIEGRAFDFSYRRDPFRSREPGQLELAQRLRRPGAAAAPARAPSTVPEGVTAAGLAALREVTTSLAIAPRIGSFPTDAGKGPDPVAAMRAEPAFRALDKAAQDRILAALRGESELGEMSLGALAGAAKSYAKGTRSKGSSSSSIENLAKHMARVHGSSEHPWTAIYSDPLLAGYDEDARKAIASKAYITIFGRTPSQAKAAKKKGEAGVVAKLTGKAGSKTIALGRPKA
jgi:hypothetical protein